MTTVSATTRLKKYFESNDFKNDAAWGGLALSVAVLAACIATSIVGLRIPSSDNGKYIEVDTPRLISALALVGCLLPILGIICTILGIVSTTEAKGIKEKIVRRSLIIGAFALFVFGVVLAQVSKAFQQADSQQYYTPEGFNKLHSTLTALQTTGITLSVFGAIAVGSTTLGLEGLKRIACAMKKKFTTIAQQKTAASRKIKIEGDLEIT